MTAVEVTISGTMFDKLNRTTQQVVIIGEASLTGLAPGHPLPPGGGSPGVPTHPIYFPDRIWGGGNEPWPTPPIVIPRPPVEPPVSGGDKPPPAEGGWGYVAEWNAWGYFPAGGKPQPVP